MEDDNLAPPTGQAPEPADEGEYGSYHHFLLAIRVPEAKPEVLSPRQARKYGKSHSENEQIDRALRDTVLLHELRHFHDCFGTLAGLSLFECHMSRVTAFLSVCSQLFNDGKYLQLPLTDWITTPECPEYVKLFVSRLATNAKLEAVFSGRVQLPVSPGPADDIYRIFEISPGVRVPAFPLQIRTATLFEEEGYPPEFTGHETHWVPIGFEQLIEGNAQALQRTYLEAVWPRISEAIWRDMTQREVLPGQEADERQRFARSPYNVTDFLLSKYLYRQHNIRPFHRARLLELTDRALTLGHCARHAGKQNMRNPGGEFVLMMEAADWSRGTKRKVSQSRMGVDALKGIIDAYAAETPLPGPTDRPNIRTSADYIWNYAIHEIALPLLRLKLKRGDELFFEPKTYMRNYPSYPTPPIIISDAGITTRRQEQTMEFLHHWVEFSLLSDICLQIWTGAARITCARAYNTIPGIQHFDLCPSQGCDSAIRNRQCQPWDPAFDDPLPPCAFRRALGNLRLREPE